jgi:hypothetical protein
MAQSAAANAATPISIKPPPTRPRDTRQRAFRVALAPKQEETRFSPQDKGGFDDGIASRSPE